MDLFTIIMHCCRNRKFFNKPRARRRLPLGREKKPVAGTAGAAEKKLVVIDELFAGELSEAAILANYRVSEKTYPGWQFDPAFIEEFERRIAATHRQTAVLLARCAPIAAAKLLQLS